MTAAIFAFLYTVLNGIADTVPVLLAALMHEGGHLLCCCVLRVPLRRFSPSPYGAVIGYDATRLSYGREAAVAASGPLVNLLSGVAALPLRGRFFTLFGVASLGLGFFNLLPLEKLDGGVILRAVLSAGGDPQKAERTVRRLSRVTTVLLFLLAGTAQLRLGGNLSLLLLSAYLLLLM